MNRTVPQVVWLGIAVLGAAALGVLALNRGETVNAAWMVVAAICVYLIAYRFYSLFLARSVLQLDPTRMTPAVRYNDGLDYVPTNKYVLFGHHFAAIAGAGPLVDPCSRLRWAICRGCSGYWPESSSPARSRISWCCSFPRGATDARLAIS